MNTGTWTKQEKLLPPPRVFQIHDISLWYAALLHNTTFHLYFINHILFDRHVYSIQILWLFVTLLRAYYLLGTILDSSNREDF